METETQYNTREGVDTMEVVKNAKNAIVDHHGGNVFNNTNIINIIKIVNKPMIYNICNNNRSSSLEQQQEAVANNDEKESIDQGVDSTLTNITLNENTPVRRRSNVQKGINNKTIRSSSVKMFEHRSHRSHRFKHQFQDQLRKEAIKVEADKHPKCDTNNNTRKASDKQRINTKNIKKIIIKKIIIKKIIKNNKTKYMINNPINNYNYNNNNNNKRHPKVEYLTAATLASKEAALYDEKRAEEKLKEVGAVDATTVNSYTSLTNYQRMAKIKTKSNSNSKSAGKSITFSSSSSSSNRLSFILLLVAHLVCTVYGHNCEFFNFDSRDDTCSNIEPFLKYVVICPAAAAAADHTRSLLDANSVFVNNGKVQWHGDLDIVASASTDIFLLSPDDDDDDQAITWYEKCKDAAADGKVGGTLLFDLVSRFGEESWLGKIDDSEFSHLQKNFSIFKPLFHTYEYEYNYVSIRQNDYHTGNWNNYIHCMSGIGTYDGKDTRTIKLPATSRLVSFADVDHDKNNDDDRTICSTSSTSVCNNIEIWKMPDEVANEQTGGVCPIVEALLSLAQEFECPASTKEKIKEVVGDANKICAGYNRTGATCLMEAVAAVKAVGKNYPFYYNVDESDGQILLRLQLSLVIPTEKLNNAMKVNAHDDAIKNWNMSNVHITDEEAGGVCPIVEALFFPSVQEYECLASASRWIASCTLDVTNNGNSTNHGKVHLIDAHGINTCPADNVPPQVGKEQGAYWCFIKEKGKRKVGEAAVHILGGINYSEANIICTGNCTRRATCRMEAVAASAVSEIRASYDSAKVVVKKSPFYHNLDESGQILRFEVYSLVVNVSWQQKEVPFFKFSLLESCVHVL